MSMKVDDLKSGKCQPCEGGIPPLSCAEAQALIVQLPGWSLGEDGKELRRSYRMKDFMTAIQLIHRIAETAEAEDHHPDLHLTNYRQLTVALSTHAIGGLSKNDFILAAKIEDLPKELKTA